jgi:trigger factor
MLYYEGYKDGVAFQGGSNMNDTKPYQLEIGSGAFIPGLEDALIGIVPSETGRDNLVDLNLTFPKDYHSAELAGKDVVFKVYIEYISEYVPAEYNEDFITKTLKYETKDTDIKASFEKYIKDEILPSIRKTEILNSIWDTLFDKAVIKSYPQSEVDYYYNSYVEQYESYKKYYEQFGMKFASLDEFVIRYLGLEEGADWKKVTREQSEIDVTQNLIFHYIAQQENITLTQTDYQNSLNYYVNYYKNQGYNYTAAQIEENLGSRLIKENALFDKVQTLLADSCNVIYKDTSEEEPEEETTETETETEVETEA